MALVYSFQSQKSSKSNVKSWKRFYVHCIMSVLYREWFQANSMLWIQLGTFLVALHGKKRISYFELKSIPRITISSKLFKLTSTMEEL